MTKVLVAFGSDECAGNSQFTPHSIGEWFEGITFHDAKRMLVENAYEWTDHLSSVMTDDEVIVDCFNELPKGFWIVDEYLYEVISIAALGKDWFSVSDSIFLDEPYHVMKKQLKFCAKDNILLPD